MLIAFRAQLANFTLRPLLSTRDAHNVSCDVRLALAGETPPSILRVQNVVTQLIGNAEPRVDSGMRVWHSADTMLAIARHIT